jgi:hypothetical protein
VLTTLFPVPTAPRSGIGCGGLSWMGDPIFCETKDLSSSSAINSSSLVLSGPVIAAHASRRYRSTSRSVANRFISMGSPRVASRPALHAGTRLMFLNQFVDSLETRNNVLQCAVASLAVRLAGIEARNRPCRGVRMIDDRNDDDAQDTHAIEGAQFRDNQLRDLFLRFWQLFHISRPMAEIAT